MNPYEVLGVARDADEDTIRKAYRKLARKFHPDLNKTPGAETRFKQVNTANEILADPEKRRAFDEFGSDSLQAGFDPSRARTFRGAGAGGNPFGGGGVDLGDLFGSMFGAGGFRGNSGRGRAQRPADAEATLRLQLVDAIRGGDQEMHLRYEDGRSETIRVPVPQGAAHLAKVRLKGRGPGGCDLVVRLDVAEHPVLRRVGNDLDMDVPVTIAEALRGASIVVPTLDGDVKVNIPAGSRTGAKLRLRGKGVPGRAGPGDLFLILRPALPDRVDDALLAAADALERGYSDIRASLKFIR